MPTAPPTTPAPPVGEMASLTGTATALGMNRRRLAHHVAAGDLAPSLVSPKGRPLFFLPAVRDRLAHLAMR